MQPTPNSGRRVPAFGALGSRNNRGNDQERAKADEPQGDEYEAAARVSRAPVTDALPETIIDAHTSFDGKLKCDRDVRVFGEVVGEISCDGTLHVAEEAVARAKVDAAAAEIEGRVEGDISCRGLLTLGPTAIVEGTIRTAGLVVMEGAVITGNVQMDSGAATTSNGGGKKSRSRSNDGQEEAAGSGRRAPSFALVGSNEEREES